MAAKANTVKSTDVTAIRAVDFTSRFNKNIQILKDIFPNIRKIEHKPGEVLYSHKVNVTLNTNTVGEGEEIPYNEVTYEDIKVGEIAWDKQSIGVSLEAISKYGYDSAVQKADDDVLFKMQHNIATKFINFIATGTLTSDFTTATFQSAVAEAIGQVSNAWENFNLGYSEIVGFCNTLDLYRELGTKDITTQREFGLEYIKDYLGFSKLFFSSKVPKGTILATPAENVILDYINAANSDFAKAGFNFTTDDENLIGVMTNPAVNKLVSEMVAVSGVGLRAEYLNGIAKVEIKPGV